MRAIEVTILTFFPNTTSNSYYRTKIVAWYMMMNKKNRASPIASFHKNIHIVKPEIIEPIVI